MCKRLVIPEQGAAESEISVAQPWWRFSVRFNVAVTHRVPVARVHEKRVEGVMMRWGYVPEPQENEPFIESKVGAALVRSDAILGSSDYRQAWLGGQRCIVPLAGFYVWHLTRRRVRQPYFVRLVNRGVFGVAALWERTVIERDDVIDSCALLTVAANRLLREIHDEGTQMPAILHRRDYDEWLTGSSVQARSLLRTYSDDRMVAHAVSPKVNYLQFDGPQLIRPAR